MKTNISKSIASIGILLLSAVQTFAHSDAFKPPFVDQLVDPYQQIQKGLADDNLEDAKAGALAFLEKMKNAPDGEETKGEVADLADPAQTIADASEIDLARQAFLDLSVTFQTLLKHVGISGDTHFYVMHCPMAFEGKGGIWIQSDKKVSNPYFGAKMPHCGSVQEEIGEAAKNEHEQKPHQGEHGHGMMDMNSGDHHGESMEHGHSMDK